VVALIAGDDRHRMPRSWRRPDILDLPPSHRETPTPWTARKLWRSECSQRRLSDGRGRCGNNLGRLSRPSRLPRPSERGVCRMTGSAKPKGSSSALPNSASPIGSAMTQRETLECVLSGPLAPRIAPDHKPRRKPSFRQRDVTRVLKGVGNAGLDVAVVKVAPDGSIMVETRKVGANGHAEGNPWDDLLSHEDH
jgi:hypothetical protein